MHTTKSVRRAVHRMTAEDDRDVLKGLIAGFAAGFIATLVMDGVEKVFLSGANGGAEAGDQPGHKGYADNLPAYTPEAQHAGTDNARFQQGEHEELTATEKVATTVASAVGVELDKPQREAGGAAVHLGFGTSVGTLYGALAEVAPVVTVGVGLPYGVAVWLLADEAALSLLGLESPPHQRPAGKHAGGFMMHLIYGGCLELLRRGIRTLL